MRTGYNAWFMEGEAGVSYMKAGTGHKRYLHRKKFENLGELGKLWVFRPIPMIHLPSCILTITIRHLDVSLSSPSPLTRQNMGSSLLHRARISQKYINSVMAARRSVHVLQLMRIMSWQIYLCTSVLINQCTNLYATIAHDTAEYNMWDITIKQLMMNDIMVACYLTEWMFLYTTKTNNIKYNLQVRWIKQMWASQRQANV